MITLPKFVPTTNPWPAEGIHLIQFTIALGAPSLLVNTVLTVYISNIYNWYVHTSAGPVIYWCVHTSAGPVLYWCVHTSAGPVLYLVPVGYPCNITAVSLASESSVLMCTDICVSVLDRRYFRYMGFGIWFILTFQMYLPGLSTGLAWAK